MLRWVTDLWMRVRSGVFRRILHVIKLWTETCDVYHLRQAESEGPGVEVFPSVERDRGTFRSR